MKINVETSLVNGDELCSLKNLILLGLTVAIFFFFSHFLMCSGLKAPKGSRASTPTGSSLSPYNTDVTPLFVKSNCATAHSNFQNLQPNLKKTAKAMLQNAKDISTANVLIKFS